MLVFIYLFTYLLLGMFGEKGVSMRSEERGMNAYVGVNMSIERYEYINYVCIELLLSVFTALFLSLITPAIVIRSLFVFFSGFFFHLVPI